MPRQRKHAVSNLLRQSILELCKASVSQDRGLEIDGILCVTFGDDSDDQIVVKVHEKITSAVTSVGSGALSECTDLTGETCPVVKYSLSQQKSGENRTAIKRAVWKLDDVEEGSATKIPRRKEKELPDETTFDCERQSNAALGCSLSPVMTGQISNTDTADCAKQNKGDGVVLLNGSTDIISHGEITIDCVSDSDGSFAEQPNECCQTDTNNQGTASSRNVIVDISGDDQVSTIEIKREVLSDDDGDFSVCLNDEFTLSVSSPGDQFNSASDPYLQEMVCEFCQLLVVDYATLREHCSSVHGAYTCPTCYRSFLQLAGYEMHLQAHRKDPLADSQSKARHQPVCPTGHKCGICGHITQTSADMLRHLSSAHEFDSVFTCSLCNQYFSNMQTFVIHRKLAHSNVQQCRCKTCDVCFTAAEFPHHKQECSKNVLIKFSGATHSNVNGYSGNPSVSRFSEQNSQSDTGNIVKLEPDFNGQHNEQNFTDGFARDGDESCLTDIGLQDGVVSSCDGFAMHCTDIDDSVLEGNPKDMLTTMPSKVFRSRIQENLFVSAECCQGSMCCQNCFEVFVQFEAYENHCRMRHGRFVCPYCMTSFANRRNQQRHTRKHTGEQPYICSECPLKFYRDDDLRRHKLKHC